MENGEEEGRENRKKKKKKKTIRLVFINVANNEVHPFPLNVIKFCMSWLFCGSIAMQGKPVNIPDSSS